LSNYGLWRCLTYYSLIFSNQTHAYGMW
jgi:hypothetical protein